MTRVTSYTFISLLLLLALSSLCESEVKQTVKSVKSWHQISPQRKDASTSRKDQSDSIRELIEAKAAKKNFECRPDFCFHRLDKKESPAVPVCATDGKTYDSKCMIKYLRRCHGQKVRVKHLGRCGFPVGDSEKRKKNRKPRCQEKRVEALRRSTKGKPVPFVPDCRKDGRFSRVQCNYQLKYCFCVRRKTGVPLSGTGVKLPRKPHCKKRKGSKKGNSPKKKKKRRCSSRQRAQFNINMLQQFEVEFNMSKATRRSGLKPRTGLPIKGFILRKSSWQPDRRAAEWKFSNLDINHDNSLSYRETKALRRITRLNIKPRTCARRFFKACDLNGNKKLERQEWNLCFGLSFGSTAERKVEITTNAPLKVSTGANIYSDSAVFRQESAERNRKIDKPIVKLQPPVEGKTTGGSLSNEQPQSLMDLLNKKKKRKNKSPFLHRSCETAKLDATRKNVAQSNSKVFVPECTPDGRFAKKQCYSSDPGEKLCFCMDPDTGSVLKQKNSAFKPGGGTGGFYLDCESLNLQQKVAQKEFRGCPNHKREKFLQQFMEYLVQTTKDKWKVQHNTMSVELRSISIKFAIFDNNKDGSLNKRERKSWRKEIMKYWKSEESEKFKDRRKTRKCARHITSFCDADSDSHLSLQEMVACLNVK